MTADPTTYTALQASLANWLNRDDLTTEIQEAIAFAERMFQRTIFTPDREAALSLTASAQSVALPANFWGLKTAPYVDAATDAVLVRMTADELRSTYPTTATGTPINFALDGTNMLLGPIPASSTSIKGTYYTVIAALSGSNATNWLLTDYSDLYEWASLERLNILLKDYEAAAMFRNMTGEVIEELNKAGQRRAANSGPLSATSNVAHVRNIQA